MTGKIRVRLAHTCVSQVHYVIPKGALIIETAVKAEMSLKEYPL